MRTNVRLALSLSLALAVVASALAADAPSPTTLDLWPGSAPGETTPVGDEQAKKKGDAITSITNVTKPTMTVSRPPSDKNTGVAVVVLPGGGYQNLAWEHEGTMVADWLNSIGVTAVVVKYRVPRRPGTPKGEPPVAALMDAQRALSLVRSHASDWGVDPKKVGILGFSAGGHLAAWASTNADKRAYETVDAADKEQCRPDFSVLIYPGGVLKRGTTDLTPEMKISGESPPAFLAVASDDAGSLEGTVALYLALKRAKVPAELHVYGVGGHGFGMRTGDRPAASWPKRCEEWMRDLGILKVR